MKKIIHAADLHLSETERDYSLAVLDEIVALAGSEKADFLIFAGDTFDRFPDAEKLRAEFRNRIEHLKCEVLLIPGNHEELDASDGNDLAHLNLGKNLILLHGKPYTLHVRENIEFLGFPFQANIPDHYIEWLVPPKASGAIRIAIAHGTVDQMDIFTGPCKIDEEEQDSALDPDIFQRFHVDYVAMGHIHRQAKKTFQKMEINYPGSARVWREGEIGQRGVNVLEVQDSVRSRFTKLKAAGQYYRVQVPISPSGAAENLSSFLPPDLGRCDWLDIGFVGIVESDQIILQLEDAMRADLGPRVRRLDLNKNRSREEKIFISANINKQPFAKEFLRIWKLQEPKNGEERQIWIKAWEMGLLEIKEKIDQQHA